MNKQQIAILALGALMVAPILAAPVMRAEPTHRLVGVGCGPERLTFTAAEEDHFPAPCYAIGTPKDMGCIATDTAKQCADYLGAGY